MPRRAFLRPEGGSREREGGSHRDSALCMRSNNYVERSRPTESTFQRISCPKCRLASCDFGWRFGCAMAAIVTAVRGSHAGGVWMRRTRLLCAIGVSLCRAAVGSGNQAGAPGAALSGALGPT